MFRADYVPHVPVFRPKLLISPSGYVTHFLTFLLALSPVQHLIKREGQFRNCWQEWKNPVREMFGTLEPGTEHCGTEVEQLRDPVIPPSWVRWMEWLGQSVCLRGGDESLNVTVRGCFGGTLVRYVQHLRNRRVTREYGRGMKGGLEPTGLFMRQNQYVWQRSRGDWYLLKLRHFCVGSSHLFSRSSVFP